MIPAARLLQQGIQAARQGRRIEARELLLRVVEAEPGNEIAWIWLTGLMDSLEDQLIACANALTINPSNQNVRAYLHQLLEKQGGVAPPADGSRALEEEKNARTPTAPPSKKIDLRGLARQQEAEGKLEEAIRALADLASTTSNSYEFDRIYREITRLEALQKEQILHIGPASSILRMTLSWPLLYLFLAIIQAGLNPFVRTAWFLWAGLPVVIAGAFLLALAELRAPHPVWRSVFSEEDGQGSGAARLAAAAAGWILIGLPHLFLLLDSMNRLSDFQIPYSSLPGG